MMNKSWIPVVLAACLQVAPAAQAQGAVVYVCVDEAGRPEYRSDSNGKACRRKSLQGVGPVVSTVPASTAPVSSAAQPAAVRGDGLSGGKMQAQRALAQAQKHLADLKADYRDGEPERRGDERNYAKYLVRKAALETDIAAEEKKIAALRRALDQ